MEKKIFSLVKNFQEEVESRTHSFLFNILEERNLKEAFFNDHKNLFSRFKCVEEHLPVNIRRSFYYDNGTPEGMFLFEININFIDQSYLFRG